MTTEGMVTQGDDLHPKYLGEASMAAVRQYLALADDRGVDVTRLLVRAGVSADAARDDSARIRADQFITIVRSLLEETGDPLLGLRSGDYVRPGSYRILGYITMSCSTLGDAIEHIVPYERLVGDMGVTSVEHHRDEVHLRWDCAWDDPFVRYHIVDNVFASWIAYARWLADRPEAKPLRVLLEHDEPASGGTAGGRGSAGAAGFGAGGEGAKRGSDEYRRRWMCEVHFAEKCNAIVMPRDMLDIPLRQPDPDLLHTLEDHARTELRSIESGASDMRFLTLVRGAIRRGLREGVSRQDVIASTLNMTPRTLQRHLTAEGSSFQALLDEVRREMATDLLQQTALPVSEIAMRLGFAEIRSFHRRFKQWTGMTPGVFRNSVRRGER